MLIRSLAVVAALVAALSSHAAVINVPADAPTIQSAINMASSGDEIVLAGAVYTGPGNRDLDLQNKALTIRSLDGDPATCVIDAQGLGSGFLALNSFTGDTVIRDLTIRNATRSNGRGGALLSQNARVTLENCVLENNAVSLGGGAVLHTGSGLLTVNGCTFRSNSATRFGGAIEVFNGGVVINRSIFIENAASIGGAIEFGQGASAQVRNSLFVRNVASGPRFGFPAYGGGAIIAINGGLISIDNSTFVANTTDHIGGPDGGGGLLIAGSSVNLDNSLFWGNEDLSGNTQNGQVKESGGLLNTRYNLIQNLVNIGGVGNVGGDPAFVDPASDDYRLGPGSAAVDAGDNGAIVIGITTDLDGAPRFVDAVNYADTGLGVAPIIDIGAYEAPANLPGLCPADLTGDGVVDASDLAALIASWGQTGSPADFNGDGVGADDLAALIAAWGPCP